MTTRVDSQKRSRTETLGQQLAVFAAYVAAAELGSRFVFPGIHASAIWPPAGIALAAALLMGPRAWPAIALGAFVANEFALPGRAHSPGTTLLLASVTAVGSTLEAVVGAMLVRAAIGRRNPLGSPRDTAWFIVLGALGVTAVNALFGVLAFQYVTGITGLGVTEWRTWWMGDLVGVLVVAPVLLAWKSRNPTWTPARIAERLAMAVALVLFAWWLSRTGAMGRSFIIPILLWVGIRFDPFECAVAALLFATGSTLATALGVPVHFGIPAQEAFLNHAGFVAIVALCLLMVSSLVRQLDHARLEAERSQERFRDLFEMHEAVMVIYDPVGGVILDANPAAEAFYGFPRETLRRMLLKSLSALPAEEHARMRNRIAHGELKNFTTTHRLASGEERRVEVRTSRVGHDERPTFLAILADITERERVERTHELLGAIVESTDDAIFTRDLDGRVLTWNPGAARMFGYRAEEVLGKLAEVMTPPERAEEFALILAGLREGRGVDGLETQRMRKDGARIDVSLTISPMRDSAGRVFGAATIARDVTERNALAEQVLHAHKLESLGTLAGGVAHDFNNLLTAMIGYTGLMKLEMCESCQIRPLLAPVENASDKARRLTASLLAFSRKQVISRRPVGVNAIVSESAGMLGRLIGANIDLDVRLDPADPTVLADAGQIEQVLMNLATNARDAMPSGGTISIGTWVCPALGEELPGFGLETPRKVRITVSDTGSGVDESLRGSIFDPFFTTKERGKGTGLGLAIAAGIVEQHGGTLELESHDGPGSTFCITLPVAEPTEAEPPETAAAPARGGNECILLAEDSAEVRKLCRTVLERCGYRVLEATDGQEAIELLEARIGEIDLVFTDVVMPKRGGREVFDAARRLRPGFPVLLTSGYVGETFPLEWIHNEGTDFLAKPASPGQMLRKVRDVLDRVASARRT